MPWNIPARRKPPTQLVQLVMQTIIRFRCFVAILLLNSFVLSGIEAQQGTLLNRADPLENLTTSGQPDAQSLKALAESGYTTVIDLRGPQENRGIDEQSLVEELGMTYFSLPVAGASGVTYENASVIDQLLSEVEGPVLVHCGSGNRVGALLALREKLNGADNEAALAFGRKAGLRGLEPTVQKILESSQ